MHGRIATFMNAFRGQAEELHSTATREWLYMSTSPSSGAGRLCWKVVARQLFCFANLVNIHCKFTAECKH